VTVPSVGSNGRSGAQPANSEQLPAVVVGPGISSSVILDLGPKLGQASLGIDCMLPDVALKARRMVSSLATGNTVDSTTLRSNAHSFLSHALAMMLADQTLVVRRIVVPSGSTRRIYIEQVGYKRQPDPTNLGTVSLSYSKTLSSSSEQHSAPPATYLSPLIHGSDDGTDSSGSGDSSSDDDSNSSSSSSSSSGNGSSSSERASRHCEGTVVDVKVFSTGAGSKPEGRVYVRIPRIGVGTIPLEELYRFCPKVRAAAEVWLEALLEAKTAAVGRELDVIEVQLVEALAQLDVLLGRRLQVGAHGIVMPCAVCSGLVHTCCCLEPVLHAAAWPVPGSPDALAELPLGALP
jgi:hypothetical protein